MRNLLVLKKIIPVLLLALGTLFFGFFILTGWPGEGGFTAGEDNQQGEVETALAMQAGEGLPAVPAELREVLRLEALLADYSGEAMQELETLAQGKGVAAYLANLSLARRGEGGDGDPGGEADLLYRRALALYDTVPVRLELAAWLAQRGRVEEAVGEYLLLVPAREAMEALLTLGASPAAVARALMDGSHWQAAAEYIAGALERGGVSPVEKRELRAWLGQCLARQGSYREALPYLEEAWESGCPETAWWYARSLEGMGAIEAAAALYRELGASGAHRLGLLLLEQGKREEGALALAGSDNPAAQWQAARLWEELGRPAKALDVYLGLARKESRYRDDAAYRAYILMQRKGGEGAEEMREILMGYPAWAVRLTGEASWEKPASIPEFEVPSFLRVVEALQQRGMEEWAAIELAIGQARADLADMLALGEWYLAKEDYFQATRWGIRSLYVEKTLRGYLLAYQRPFAELVYEAAQRYELNPHLIWAVMREESHFRPRAVSPAGAMGLMQVMPATGVEIAGRKGVELPLDGLLQPEVNIDFGAFYLRQMLDMFGGDLDKALAAYNGGPGNVRRWSKSPLGGAPADFPTAITFFETREYITKVFESYLTYNWLYGE